MPGWFADDGKANREAEVRLLTSFETSTDLVGASGECGCGQQEAEEQRQEEKERRIDHYPLGQEIARDREQGPIANACGGRAAQVVPAGAQPLQRTVDRDILARLTPQACSPWMCQPTPVTNTTCRGLMGRPASSRLRILDHE